MDISPEIVIKDVKDPLVLIKDKDTLDHWQVVITVTIVVISKETVAAR